MGGLIGTNQGKLILCAGSVKKSAWFPRDVIGVREGLRRVLRQFKV